MGRGLGGRWFWEGDGFRQENGLGEGERGERSVKGDRFEEGDGLVDENGWR